MFGRMVFITLLEQTHRISAHSKAAKLRWPSQDAESLCLVFFYIHHPSCMVKVKMPSRHAEYNHLIQIHVMSVALKLIGYRKLPCGVYINLQCISKRIKTCYGSGCVPEPQYH